MSARDLTGSLTFGLVAALSSITDLRERRIPDELVGIGFITALLLTSSLGAALAGAAFGSTSFLVVRILCRGRMGLGDVKLAGYFAAVLGTRLWWLAVALACAAALAAMALRACLGRRPVDRSLPFAPFLSLGALAALLLSRLTPSFVAGVAP